MRRREVDAVGQRFVYDDLCEAGDYPHSAIPLAPASPVLFIPPDWLQRQLRDGWQDRWLAGGADAGFDGAELPLCERVPVRRHHRDELSCGWR